MSVFELPLPILDIYCMSWLECSTLDSPPRPAASPSIASCSSLFLLVILPPLPPWFAFEVAREPGPKDGSPWLPLTKGDLCSTKLFVDFASYCLNALLSRSRPMCELVLILRLRRSFPGMKLLTLFKKLLLLLSPQSISV